MTNDRDIVRYEVNEHGELPLSYGRYVRWEDYEDAVRELMKQIDRLQDEGMTLTTIGQGMMMGMQLVRGNMEIKRYATQECCIGWETVWEDEEGEFVRYEDHIAIVENLKERIDKLEGNIIEMMFYGD